MRKECHSERGYTLTEIPLRPSLIFAGCKPVRVRALYHVVKAGACLHLLQQGQFRTCPLSEPVLQQQGAAWFLVDAQPRCTAQKH
jgi:hypothetical protein